MKSKLLILALLLIGINDSLFCQNASEDSVKYGMGKGLLPVDVLPSYPGGQKSWDKHLKKTLKYPEVAKRDKLEGDVFISFVVEKDGTISNLKEVQSPHESLTKEAKKAMSESSSWSSAKVAGKPVRCRMLIRIQFKL